MTKADAEYFYYLMLSLRHPQMPISHVIEKAKKEFGELKAFCFEEAEPVKASSLSVEEFFAPTVVQKKVKKNDRRPTGKA